MSEVIETGSKRVLPKDKTERQEAIGKKRKIDTSEDEVELGHFVGDAARKGGSGAPSTAKSDPGEVVGPKRKNPHPADIKSQSGEPPSSKADDALQIAAPLAVDDEPSTPRPRAKRRRSPLASAGTSWGRLAALALLSLLLVALTGAAFLLMPRYDILGEPLIADPAFEAGLDAWQQAGLINVVPDDPGQIVIESFEAGARTHLVKDITLPPGGTLLILRAQVQGEDVVTGPELWDSARIYLVPLDAEGEPDWKETQNLFALSGTTDVRNYRQAFSMPADVEVARLGIEMKNATGRLSVNNLELTAVDYKPTFKVVVGCLLIAWTLVVLYTGIKTFSGIESVRIRLWLGVVCALSVVALMLPGGMHDAGADSIAARFGLDAIGLDSIGHGVMFTVLAFLVRLGRPSDPLWLQAGVWCLIAIASEVLQLFTVGRDPSLDDLWVDGLGMLLGLALAEIARRVRRSPAA